MITKQDLDLVLEKLKANNVCSFGDGRFVAIINKVPDEIRLEPGVNPLPGRVDYVYLGCDSKYHYFTPKLT